MFLDLIKNKTVFANKYHTHGEAAIVACYFNPQKSPYCEKAFKLFYDSIRHLNHLIVECIIGDDTPQLPNDGNVLHVFTRDLLWHKEALLNKAVQNLPSHIKYVFWVDADVTFTNFNWLVEGVERLQTNVIVQPFEYCVHLEKDELVPAFDLELVIGRDRLPNRRNNRVWRSFCANFTDTLLWQDPVYDNHGHVGFAWGARREAIEAVPLYDRALIGGADHIIAHAAAGQIDHPCIAKSFTDSLDDVRDWSERFHAVTEGRIGYVGGNLYHYWHGDVAKREYLKRIQEFTPLSKDVHRGGNGLFQAASPEADRYVREYFARREVAPVSDNDFLEPSPAGLILDFGMRRSGKSVTASEVIDEALAESIPVSILDYPCADGMETESHCVLTDDGCNENFS
jgi:hypothetical protein